MSFQDQLHTQLAKIRSTNPSKAETKQAIKEALKLAPPTPAERAAFLQAQKPEGKATFIAAEREVNLQKKLANPKNLMYGLGAGSAVLFFLGAPVLLPVAAAGGALYLYKKHKPGVMTPERKKVYEQALKSLKDPVKLRALADAFDKEGLSKEADLLRKRAGLRELPKDVSKARRGVFKKAMRSTDVHGIEKLAVAFEGEGATGAAEALRIHAAAVKAL